MYLLQMSSKQPSLVLNKFKILAYIFLQRDLIDAETVVSLIYYSCCFS